MNEGELGAQPASLAARAQISMIGAIACLVNHGSDRSTRTFIGFGDCQPSDADENHADLDDQPPGPVGRGINRSLEDGST
jgi:hypothetical protein